MKNDKVKRLNDLIELYKSSTITKEEYEHLKKELFLVTNVKLNNDSVKTKTENRISEISKTQNNYQRETSSGANKKIVRSIIIIISLGLFFLQIYNIKGQKNQEYNPSTIAPVSNPTETTSNICAICSKEFNNRGYEEVYDGVWKELEVGNQGQICSPACGRKHNQQFSDVAKKYGVDLEESETNSGSEGDYKMGNDGRVYERNRCSLCKGTGIETAHNMAGTQSRICPMCEGRGVRSY